MVREFSSSADFSLDDPDFRLPFPFSFQTNDFLLSHLEPCFRSKPKSVHQYPYETSAEHFERFTNVSDSLASRIPIVRPHDEKGGPIATQIISTLRSGTLPSDSFPLSYIVSSNAPVFYILLAPFPTSWQMSLQEIIPSPLTFKPCKLIDITCFSPQYIILDLPPRSFFPIPFLPPSGTSFSDCGWLSISSFSKVKLVYELLSAHHLKIFVKFLSSLEHLCPSAVLLALPSLSSLEPVPLPPSADTPQVGTTTPLLELDDPCRNTSRLLSHPYLSYLEARL